MSKFTKEMVDDYALKLLIGLSDEENKMVLEEFDAIDRNIDLINKIPNMTLFMFLLIFSFLQKSQIFQLAFLKYNSFHLHK